MNVKKALCGVCLSIGLVGLVPASRAQECKARVLAPVTDDMGNHWKVGSILPVDIDREDGGSGAFCASGGSCVPRKADGVVTLTLINCKVGATIGGTDYKLVPDAKLSGAVGAAQLQTRQNVESKLSAMGFSNVSAGSLADDYVNHPRSRNGRLVAGALAGSPPAIAELKRNNP